jgi:deoxycytidine triphosphate deaminase
MSDGDKHSEPEPAKPIDEGDHSEAMAQKDADVAPPPPAPPQEPVAGAAPPAPATPENGQPRKCGVLTAEDIRPIIKWGFDEDYLRAASYDLRAGHEVILCGQNKLQIDHLKRNSGDVGVTVGAFETVIFSTHEILEIPCDVVGRFDLRITWGMKGLFLQVGPQIEPGYIGRLFGALLNVTGAPVTIPFEKALLTVEFHYTCKPVKPSSSERDQLLSLSDYVQKKDHIRLEKLAEPNLVQMVDEKYKYLAKVNDENTRRLNERFDRLRAETVDDRDRKRLRWQEIGVWVAATALVMNFLLGVGKWVWDASIRNTSGTPAGVVNYQSQSPVICRPTSQPLVSAFSASEKQSVTVDIHADNATLPGRAPVTTPVTTSRSAASPEEEVHK